MEIGYQTVDHPKPEPGIDKQVAHTVTGSNTALSISRMLQSPGGGRSERNDPSAGVHEYG